MPSADDLRGGQLIASCNLAHGSVTTRLDEAFDALIKATDAYAIDPSAIRLEPLNVAGEKLATVAVGALRGPPTGVDASDKPRLAGIKC